MIERPSKTYQDQWVKGKLIVKGTRECASRYEIIKSFCSSYSRPFSVLDIGANMCYFGIRLTEDFPLCTVVAFEYDHFEMRAMHVQKNYSIRLLLLNHKLNINDLFILGACSRFDVVLILSVLHHVGNEFDAWLKALRQLGDNIICEFATTDSRSRKQSKDYCIPSDAKILGYGDSHIKKSVKRPIVLLTNHKQVHAA